MVKTNTIEQSSKATRQRLIETGLHYFAQYGIEGVRTRTLAEAASVNQSAIPYHFGGKEGVYAAVIDEIADEIHRGLYQSGLLVCTLKDIADQTLQESREHLSAILRQFTHLILNPGRTHDRTILIVREQLQPTVHFDVLFKKFIEPLHMTLSCLIGKLTQTPPTDEQVIIKAQALAGQIIAFAVARQAYLQRSQSSDISSKQVDLIADTVSEMALNAMQT